MAAPSSPTRRHPSLLPLLLLHVLQLIRRSTAAAAAPTDNTTSSSLLGTLLGPVPGAAAFARDFWQQKPAVIRRHNPTFYQPVMRSADLDALLAFSQDGWKLVKRVKGKDGEWWSSSPPEPESVGDEDLVAAAVRRVERAHAAFGKGFSLVVDRLDEKHDGVGRLAAAVEAEVGHRVGANLYWTPGQGSQAFEAHFDWMDAFVLQVEGRKRWLLYDAVVEQPRPDMEGKPPARAIEEPFVDFVLEAGDLLYLPSGLIHEAHTLAAADGGDGGAGPPSLHLTLGMESTVFGSWESLLLELVAAATEEETGEEKDKEMEEILMLRCPDGSTLHATLSAPIFPSSHLRWGDLLALFLVQLAPIERALRRAVPLSPLLVEGAGGQDAVLRELGRLGSLVREKGADAAVASLAAEGVGKLMAASADGTGNVKLPRSLGPEGSAGRRVQRRLERTVAGSLLDWLARHDVKEGLAHALRQLECTLQSHPAAAMRRFAAVAARDREARHARRREKLEQLAFRVGEEMPEVFAVGGRGGGGEGEGAPGRGGEL